VKRSKRKAKRSSELKVASGQGTSFVDRNIAATDPLKQQFEPTADSPIRLHHRMAGIE